MQNRCCHCRAPTVGIVLTASFAVKDCVWLRLADPWKNTAHVADRVAAVDACWAWLWTVLTLCGSIAIAAQSAKAACAAALENAEGVREALKAKDTLEATQKSSTAAYRAHSVRSCPHSITADSKAEPGNDPACVGSWGLLTSMK